MTLPLPKMIIFDVDETVAVFHVGWKIIEKFAQKYSLTITDEIIQQYNKYAFYTEPSGEKRPICDDSVALSILNSLMPRNKRDDIKAEWKQIMSSLNEGYVPLDGALETIDYFRAQKIPVTFITSGANRRFIEHLGILKEGDLYYGGETEIHGVVKAECIKCAMKKQGITDPKSVWAVGDAPNDMDAAIKVGVISIATTECGRPGYNTIERLLENDPSAQAAIISNLPELQRLHAAERKKAIPDL